MAKFLIKPQKNYFHILNSNQPVLSTMSTMCSLAFLLQITREWSEEIFQFLEFSHVFRVPMSEKDASIL
jgi:hypothetical protein